MVVFTGQYLLQPRSRARVALNQGGIVEAFSPRMGTITSLQLIATRLIACAIDPMASSRLGRATPLIALKAARAFGKFIPITQKISSLSSVCTSALAPLSGLEAHFP